MKGNIAPSYYDWYNHILNWRIISSVEKIKTISYIILWSHFFKVIFIFSRQYFWNKQKSKWLLKSVTVIKQHESLHQRCSEMPKNNNNNEPVYALFPQIVSHILSKEPKQSKQTCMSVHAHTDTHNRTEQKWSHKISTKMYIGILGRVIHIWYPVPLIRLVHQ